jgi:hypothetical protein
MQNKIKFNLSNAMAKYYYKKPKFQVKTYGDYLKEAAAREPELYSSAMKRYRKWSDTCMPPCFREKDDEKSDDELFKLWITRKEAQKSKEK